MTDTQIIKKALIAHFGKNRVLSVKRGRGTACGWIEISLLTDKPKNCTCQNYEYCYQCKTAMRDADNKAMEIVKSTKVELSTYPDDMGYGDHDCVLVDVKLAGV